MLNVLVVEDDADIRNLLKDQIEDKGCKVRVATNGSAGLRRVQQQIPDLMFVDIMMPVMDGIEFIAELKKSPKTSRIPIVLLTAVSTPSITMRAIEMGVKFRLTKPWELSELDFVFEQSLALQKG